MEPTLDKLIPQLARSTASQPLRRRIVTVANVLLPRHGHLATPFGALLWLVALLGVAPQIAWAQSGDTVPRQGFFRASAELYSGQYRDAVREFQSQVRGARKSIEGRWIDSICYFAMLGEAYYQLGQYDAALESYDAAVELFLAHRDWLMQVNFPATIQPDTNRGRQPTPWGRSARNVPLGRFPATMTIATGRIDNSQQYNQGGVIRPAMLHPVNVVEIVRCTALAIRRRGELLGPLAPYDKLTDRVVDALARRPGPPNHWSSAWVDMELGVAQAAANKPEQAKSNLERSLLVAGQYDHPLSCVAMIELGRLALDAGDTDRAAQMFQEALYSAYYFENVDALQEALRYGAQTHLIANRPGIYPPLEVGAAWARRERLRHVETWITVSAAENQATLGQIDAANASLKATRQLMGRGDMAGASVGARADYVAAMIGYQAGNVKQASAMLTAALAPQRIGSRWLFQLSLTDRQTLSGALSARSANQVYGDLLRDPTAHDWLRRPLESLSVLVTPHPQSYELWFESAYNNKEVERAVEIADAARRHRFYSSLPLGGRLLSLRWILESDPAELPEEARLQRQDLVTRYPQYDEMAGRAHQLRQTIAAAGVLPADADQLQKQVGQFDELGELALAREAMLRRIALARLPAEMVFPPSYSMAELQSKLPPGQALLVFYSARGAMYGFLLGSDEGRYAHWQVRAPQQLHRQIIALLRELGNMDPNRQLPLETLTNDGWKKIAHDVWKQLFEGSNVDVSRDIQELAIVPDGALWYLPFETLVPNMDDSQPLLNYVRTRYAPTASLAVPDLRPQKPTLSTGVVIGHLFPRDADEVAEGQYEKLREVIDRTVALRVPLPAPPAVVGSVLDSLIVLDDVDPAGPYDWLPLPSERGQGDVGMQDWMALPWGGPTQIMLPGFHTAAETALRRRGGVVDGSDLFLPVCAMMADGARTIVISRWRTGGQSSVSLMQKFAQQLSDTSPAAAWQRSAQLLQTRSVDWQQEPRVQRFDAEVPPPLAHPFFWSGYVLVDGGTKQTAEAPLAGNK